MMARTPYRPMSPGVKRSMRVLVVVPTQIFSHLSPFLRRLGAVWMQGMPARLTGGGLLWSKIWIWVRSRMPNSGPSK